MSTLYTSGWKIKLSKLYTSGSKVNNVNNMHKLLKGLRWQHYAQVAKRLKMSTLYKSG